MTPDRREGGPRFPHVYVHVPFCRRRCSYCDFSIAVRREVPTDLFIRAVLAELAARGLEGGLGPISSIYLGGGTPSQLGVTGIAQLLGAFRQMLHVDDFSTDSGLVEVTLEANPEDVTGPAADEWVNAGVTRVSLGVQSFDPAVLKWMHRSHSPDRVVEAVGILRGAGIRNLSLDLIFSLPAELGRDWSDDLERALSLAPDHLSVYGLTIEPRTPLGRWTARGQSIEAPDESFAGEFLFAHERLRLAGFEHYEVSNYARPGFRSLHNSAYWTGASYLGLGPSSHGFDGAVRRWNVEAYAAWLERVQSGMDPIEGSEVIGMAERVAEDVYLGLRTDRGLVIGQTDAAMVGSWVREAWAVSDGTRVRLTAEGWLRLDSLAASLTSIRSRS